MKKNWFRNRLTTAKQESGLWTGLADSVQDVIEKHVSPSLDRLKNRVSIFNMPIEDQQTILNEMGDFFNIGSFDKENVPIIIMQREDEVHQKKTLYPLYNTIYREFGGLRVTVRELYAPIDIEKYPYGSILSSLEDIDKYQIDKDDWFLTSRIVIGADANEIMRVYGEFADPMKEIEDRIQKNITPLIPLRIVYDGNQFSFEFDIKNQIRQAYEYNDNYRMDTHRCDGLQLDIYCDGSIGDDGSFGGIDDSGYDGDNNDIALSCFDTWIPKVRNCCLLGFK
ncbi:hypothetical protein VXS06_14385 [Photobacterium toruni]|uniref:Uncharacterized protein n=1 Tax=Photobacterium toruni TaxID=1935446 RepID=A0ABU6L9G5_9GAMM|nr:hypothetical protein [Photobacterium toruni]